MTARPVQSSWHDTLTLVAPFAALLDELNARAATGTVTLIYSSRDEAHNNAVALKELLERRAG